MVDTARACEQRRCVPKLEPGADPRETPLCVCDHEYDRLLALMGEGLEQRDASLQLWAPDQMHKEAN